MKKRYFFITLLLTINFSDAQSPALFADLNPGTGNFSPNSFIEFNGALYFSGDDSSGTNTNGVDVGRELWKTDGTVAGTAAVKDINTGSNGSSPFNLFIFNGNLYFTAIDGGAEL
jgi:ELWxxDGT repeat protein